MLLVRALDDRLARQRLAAHVEHEAEAVVAPRRRGAAVLREGEAARVDDQLSLLGPATGDAGEHGDGDVLARDGEIDHPHYQAHIERAPLFLKRERERLAAFIRRHIRHGDRRGALYTLENGRIRPSKMLADSVQGLLQGKPEQAVSDVGRFLLNSTFGVVGMFDLATENGLRKHNEDFGQTLAVWGVPAGPYLMLPGLGPSTVRDALAFTVDYNGSVRSHIDSQSVRLSMTGLDVLQARVRALPAQAMMDQALDRYLLIRDAHLQRRRSQIYDGNPPESR